MAAFYDVMELSTAVKPWLLRTLLERDGVDSVSYLDPDIQVFSSLAKIEEEAVRHGIVLTPHFTVPLPRDGRKPSEEDILIAGTYNLGFIGLGAGSERRRAARLVVGAARERVPERPGQRPLRRPALDRPGARASGPTSSCCARRATTSPTGTCRRGPSKPTATATGSTASRSASSTSPATTRAARVSSASTRPGSSSATIRRCRGSATTTARCSRRPATRRPPGGPTAGTAPRTG